MRLTYVGQTSPSWCGLDPRNSGGNQESVAAEPAGLGSAAQSLAAEPAAVAELAVVLQSGLELPVVEAELEWRSRRPYSTLLLQT